MKYPEFIPIAEINKLETFFEKGITHFEEKLKKIPEFDPAIQEEMKGHYDGVISGYRTAIIKLEEVKRKRVGIIFTS